MYRNYLLNDNREVGMKSKVIWIGRDKDGYYNVATNKMEWMDDCFVGQDELFCKDKFEKLIGLKLKSGQQGKFKLIQVGR